jgi:hypothetical protein
LIIVDGTRIGVTPLKEERAIRDRASKLATRPEATIVFGGFMVSRDSLGTIEPAFLNAPYTTLECKAGFPTCLRRMIVTTAGLGDVVLLFWEEKWEGPLTLRARGRCED